MTEPSLVDELMSVVLSHYKSLDQPQWSFVREVFDRHPYNELIARLAETFRVVEDTDFNYDVSFGYLLYRNDEGWVLVLSMLGPYAAVLRIDTQDESGPISMHTEGLTASERSLLETLAVHGIRMLPRDVLEHPVPIKLDLSPLEGTPRLYHTLFRDEYSLPW